MEPSRHPVSRSILQSCVEYFYTTHFVVDIFSSKIAGTFERSWSKSFDEDVFEGIFRIEEIGRVKEESFNLARGEISCLCGRCDQAVCVYREDSIYVKRRQRGSLRR